MLPQNILNNLRPLVLLLEDLSRELSDLAEACFDVLEVAAEDHLAYFLLYFEFFFYAFEFRLKPLLQLHLPLPKLLLHTPQRIRRLLHLPRQLQLLQRLTQPLMPILNLRVHFFLLPVAVALVFAE
jgi:hypothetical protein